VSFPALVVASALAAQETPGATAELRGLWVVRTGLTSPAAVDRVVEEAAQGGLNALFVQVRGRGDAFYSSRLVARSPLLSGQPAKFDPLRRLLDRARERGLAVHAWVNVLLTSHFQPVPGDNVVALHPDWIMLPRDTTAPPPGGGPGGLLSAVRQKARGNGDAEGFYLSPSSAPAGDHLEAVVREVVAGYEIDGLHFDFIRYPSLEYDYSRVALDGFRRLSGGSVAAQAPAAWAAYRRDVLTNLAARLSRVAREERPRLRISAAVVPDQATALHQKFQAWPEWLAIGILDAVCPMAYTQDLRIFQEQIGEARARVKPGQGLWAGVGAYRLSLAEVAERIAAARAIGATGYVLFSHESFAGGDLRQLRGGR